MNRFFYWLTLIGLFGSNAAVAELYNYSSVITLCTGTCASFASLDVGSTITGTIQIDTEASGTFGDANVMEFSLSIFNPGVPPSGPVGDPVTDNPFVLDSSLGSAVSNGTAGTTDAANELNGGQLLLEMLVPPFDTNETFAVFNLATGNGQICIFFVVAGCIPNATEAVKFEGQFNFIDSDGDLLSDDVDNCSHTANADQRDTDGDGHGNACDPDLNNDCVVNVIDLGLFKTVIFTSDADADFNNDGVVNDSDLDLVRAFFFNPPGFSGPGALCNGPFPGSTQ